MMMGPAPGHTRGGRSRTRILGTIVCLFVLFNVPSRADEVTAFVHDYGRRRVYSLVDVPSTRWDKAEEACTGARYRGAAGVFAEPDTYMKRSILLALGSDSNVYPTEALGAVVVAVNAKIIGIDWKWTRSNVKITSSSRATCNVGTCYWADVIPSEVASDERMVVMIGRRNFANLNGDWSITGDGAYHDTSSDVKGFRAFCEFDSRASDALPNGSTVADDPTRYSKHKPQLASQFAFAYTTSFTTRTMAFAADVGQMLVERSDSSGGMTGYYLYTPGDVQPVLVLGKRSGIDAGLLSPAPSGCTEGDQTTTLGVMVSKLRDTAEWVAAAPTYVGGNVFYVPNGHKVMSLTFSFDNTIQPVLADVVGSRYCADGTTESPEYLDEANLGTDARTAKLPRFQSAMVTASHNALYLAGGAGQILRVPLDTFVTSIFAGRNDGGHWIENCETIGPRDGFTFSRAHTMVWDETETVMYTTLAEDLNILQVSTSTDLARTLWGTNSPDTVQWFQGEGYGFGAGIIMAQVVRHKANLMVLTTENQEPMLTIVDTVRRTKRLLNFKSDTSEAKPFLGIAQYQAPGLFIMSSTSRKYYAMQFGGTESLSKSVSGGTSTISVSRSKSASRSGGTRSVSATVTTTPSVTSSGSVTPSPTVPPTRTATPTATATTSPSASGPTPSPSRTVTSTASPSRSVSETSATVSASASVGSISHTPTPSFTPPSFTPSVSRRTQSRTLSPVTPTRATLSLSPSSDATASASLSPTQRLTLSRSLNATTSLSLEPSPSGTETADRASPSTSDSPSGSETASASKYVGLPELVDAASGIRLAVSLNTVETVGRVRAAITLVGGNGPKWRPRQLVGSRKLERLFGAMADSDDTGADEDELLQVPLCHDACVVTHVEPASYLRADVQRCNETHLVVRFQSQAPFPTGRRRPRLEGTLNLAHECLQEQPSSSTNLSTGFVIDDDRPVLESPIPKSVVESTQTATVAASVASAVVANPSVATQASRVGAALRLAYCEGEFDEPSLAEHPFGFTVGEDPDGTGANMIVGAAAGGMLMIVGFLAVQLALGSAWRAYHACKGGRRSVVKTWLVCVGDTRFPGMGVVPLLMYQQTIVRGSIVAFVHLPEPAPLLVGVTGLLFTVGVGVALSALLFRHLHCYRREVGTGGKLTDTPEEAAARKEADAATADLDALLLLGPAESAASVSGKAGPDGDDDTPPAGCECSADGVKAFIFGTGKWCTSATLREEGVHYTRHFGFLVVDYSAHAYWFVLAEILFGTLIAGVDAVNPADQLGCRIVAWSAATFFVAYAVGLCILRPFCVPFHTVVFLPCAVVEAVGVVCIAAFTVAEDEEWLLTAGTYLPILAASALVVKEMVDMVLMIIEGLLRVHAHVTKKPSRWMHFLDRSHLKDDDDLFNSNTVDDGGGVAADAAKMEDDGEAAQLLVVPMSEREVVGDFDAPPLDAPAPRAPVRPDPLSGIIDPEDGSFLGPSPTATGDLKYNELLGLWMVRAKKVHGPAAANDPFAGYVPTAMRGPVLQQATDHMDHDGAGVAAAAANDPEVKPHVAAAREEVQRAAAMREAEAAERDEMRASLLRRLGARTVADAEHQAEALGAFEPPRFDGPQQGSARFDQHQASSTFAALSTAVGRIPSVALPHQTAARYSQPPLPVFDDDHDGGDTDDAFGRSSRASSEGFLVPEPAALGAALAAPTTRPVASTSTPRATTGGGFFDLLGPAVREHDSVATRPPATDDELYAEL